MEVSSREIIELNDEFSSKPNDTAGIASSGDEMIMMGQHQKDQRGEKNQKFQSAHKSSFCFPSLFLSLILQISFRCILYLYM